MITSQTITKLVPALLSAQKKMANATKDSKNPFYKSSYADLNAIREVVIPALNAEGIVVLQPSLVRDGKNYVQTIAMHESGEFMASDGTEIICAKQNDPQAQGSSKTYARRYDMQEFFNVGAKDDDAEDAMDRKSKKLEAAPKNEWKTEADTKASKVKPVESEDTW